MKMKVIKVFCILLAFCMIGGLMYIGIGKHRIESKMLDYLKKENYTEADIASMNVEYSLSLHHYFTYWLDCGDCVCR